jgi:hypothetical protein
MRGWATDTGSLSSSSSSLDLHTVLPPLLIALPWCRSARDPLFGVALYMKSTDAARIPPPAISVSSSRCRRPSICRAFLEGLLGHHPSPLAFPIHLCPDCDHRERSSVCFADESCLLVRGAPGTASRPDLGPRGTFSPRELSARSTPWIRRRAPPSSLDRIRAGWGVAAFAAGPSTASIDLPVAATTTTVTVPATTTTSPATPNHDDPDHHDLPQQHDASPRHCWTGLRAWRPANCRWD